MINKESFSDKRLILEKARKNLKSYFVGIDPIIDDIIEKITAWYLFPEASMRPLIINLWGLTGVGKTDLIRKLSKEILFQDKFMEIQMTNKGDVGWDKSICSKLMDSDIDSGSSGILLLDEIQRFRTIDQKGDEIHDYNFQDIWMLLSDGRFGGSAHIKGRIMEAIMDIAYDADSKENEGEELPATAGNESKGTKSKDKSLRKFSMSFWRAKRIKKLLPTSYDVSEIMTWRQEKLLQELEQALSSSDSYEEIDYSKLLIFVSGNLDEAFRVAANVSDADQDADEVHKRTKSIDMIVIKESLRSRFKPEQISRLGNIHIIYPSLDKKAFLKIIQNRLKSIEEKLLACTGIKVTIYDSIAEDLYRNGVFPTQGVRPVLSTVDDFINRYVPSIIIDAIEQDSDSISIGVEGSLVNSTIYRSGKPVSKKNYDYTGLLTEIRKKRSDNRNAVLLTSVHECGHALIYALLYKIAPTQITVNTTSLHSDGFVGMHQSELGRDDQINLVTMYLGGVCAETLVFGIGNTSMGSSSDIQKATNIITSQIRRCGQFAESSLGVIVSESQPESSHSVTNLNDSNLMTENMLQACRLECIRMLEQHMPLLKALSLQLSKTLSLPPLLFQKICNEHNVVVSILPSEDLLQTDYESKFNKWISK